MRIVGCGLIAVAALLGLSPAALASEPADGRSSTPASAVADATPAAGSADRAVPAHQAGGPQTEVSLLAVSLTAGAAVAAAGSGVAQAVHRRRAVSRTAGHPVRDAVHR